MGQAKEFCVDCFDLEDIKQTDFLGPISDCCGVLMVNWEAFDECIGMNE